jgi:hypothetical protein
MTIVIVDVDNFVVVRTIESLLSGLPGRYRVVRRGADETATEWLSAEKAERRLHYEASLRGYAVRDLRAFDEHDNCVMAIECDTSSANIAWKSV